jgi:bifunctional DNase/RNase
MLEMTIDSIRVSMMNYQHVVILKEKGSDRYLPIWIGPAEADAISVKLQNLDIARPLTHDLLKNTVYALELFSGTSVSKVVVNDLRSDTFYAQIIFEFKDGPIPIKVDPEKQDGSTLNVIKNNGFSFEWGNQIYNVKIITKWQENNNQYMEAEGDDGLLFELCFNSADKNWFLTKMKLDSRPSDAIALAVRVTRPIYVEDSVLDKAGIILDKDTGKPLPTQSKGEGESDKVDEQELKKMSAFYDFINTLDLDDLGKHKS